MGASCWKYTVAWQSDLDAALRELRERVFADGDYWWAEGGYCPDDDAVTAEQRAKCPPPATMAALFAAEAVQYDGTHSILDVERVVAAGETPEYGDVQPLTAEEIREHVGVDLLTREHLPALANVPTERWIGRCAVLHDDQGRPAELHFWGHSGD